MFGGRIEKVERLIEVISCLNRLYVHAKMPQEALIVCDRLTTRSFLFRSDILTTTNGEVALTDSDVT